jgi:cytoskeleton protein RodZ
MADILRLTLDNGGELAWPGLYPRKTSGDADVALESVGQELSKARQRSGKMLMDVWRELKINPDYLLAIEESRFEALPGRVYAIGFVRSYAAYLGLNADELVDRLKTEMAGPDASEPVIGLVPPPESNMPRGGSLLPAERKPMLGVLPPPERNLREGGPLVLSESKLPQAVVAGLMAAVLLYSGYYVFVSAQSMVQPPVIPVPARLMADAGLTQERVAAPGLATVERPAPRLPAGPCAACGRRAAGTEIARRARAFPTY